ncbi:MAG TPA: hypothetical protein VFN91_11505, partial [Myxococcaceae bacterium]|nr:hypothetical protein [Myxococcaceae bacterium]
YCIEHTWAWLAGHPLHRHFWDLPFFFPAPNTGAYSDVLLGVAPPYWLFRALGASPDRAYAGWLLVSTALNAAVATWVFRGALGVRWLAAAAGGVLVAAGAPRVHLINHPQLIGTYWILAAMGLAVVALRAPGTHRARLAWVLAGVAAAAEAWSSYYLWWFLVFGAVIALLLGLALRSTRPAVLEALRRDWPAIAAAGVLSLLLVLPLLQAWWSAAHAVGLRDARDVFLARGQSWFNVGPDSWWWGALVRSSPGMRSQTPEQQYGIGVLTTAVVAFGFWRARHRGGVVVLGLTAVLLVLLATQFGPWRAASPWNLIYAVVPGARGIRAVPRVGLLVLVAWAAGLALAVDALARSRPWVAAVLALLCLVEQRVADRSFEPGLDRERVDRIARQVPPGCAAFVYTPAPDGWPPWHAQIDALWVADAVGVPTLNGYSGNSPPGWGLEDCFVRGPADRERLDAAVAAWVQRWGLTRPVCRVPASP